MIPVTLKSAEALAVLTAGGVIAYPTESVYGLGCRADREHPVERILQLKERSRERGLIVLIDRLDTLGDWVDLTPELEKRALEAWPGPVTWLVPASPRCPQWLNGGGPSLAVRMPEHATCRELCRELGNPLVSTSANPPGKPGARSPEEIREYFSEPPPELIFESPLGGRDTPSEIRDLLTGNKVR